MPTILPIQYFRPAKHFAKRFIRKPSDFSSIEKYDGLEKLLKNSVFSISQPEIFGYTFEEGQRKFDSLLRNGYILTDVAPGYYLYTIQTNSHSQTGLVCLQSLEDIQAGKMLLHERTRSQSSNFLKRRIAELNLNFTPVFSILPDDDEHYSRAISRLKETAPIILEVETETEKLHQIQQLSIEEGESLKKIIQSVGKIYLADGHHRLAVISEFAKRENRKPYFPSIVFPSGQLKIYSFAKILRELNDDKIQSFLAILKNNFPTFEISSEEIQPGCIEVLYNGEWTSYQFISGVLSTEKLIYKMNEWDHLMKKQLAIQNLEEDERVLFVKDIYGRESIARFLDKTKSQLAIRIHPICVEDIFYVSNHKMQLPPKSTLFQPKPRAGLFITRI